MMSIAHSARYRASALVLVLVLALVVAVFSPALPALADEEFSGQLANGTEWIAAVPEDWNGTLLLYSHGYVPSFIPFPNPTPAINTTPAATDLLDLGYAVAASSYAHKGWAFPTAPNDQLNSLQAAIDAIGIEPDTVLAYGSSMGGLVTALLAESAGDVIDGALPTCGIVAGGADLNNYQLDAAHAINELLADGNIQIAGYETQAAAFAATGALTAAVSAGDSTSEGLARVALAAALYQVPDSQLGAVLGFVTPARYDLITAAGGDSGWNEGIDYWQLLSKSPYRQMVAAQYREAGLDLRADLDLLTGTADVSFNDAAVDSMLSHSQPDGDLQMPVFSIHTTDDLIVPVEHEEEYADDVRSNGMRSLFRQAFVDRSGHCNFTSAELIAGVKVLEERVTTGLWNAASINPHMLNQLASSLGLGESAFIHFQPGEFIGDRSDSVNP
ncbi:MAG TPA: alpha/beta hydrolase [Acidimicrobiia bacterium]|nr:alpha/beta hydrolase [Acidimicrobiia bacterium]